MEIIRLPYLFDALRIKNISALTINIRNAPHMYAKRIKIITLPYFTQKGVMETGMDFTEIWGTITCLRGESQA